MKMNELLTPVTKFAGKTGLIIKKNSPELLMGAGITGVIITIVCACKATTRADEVLDHHAEKMKRIHDAEQFQDEECPYPPAVAVKEKAVVYAQTGLEFGRLYGPTLAMGSLSIACILASNRILNKRYLAVVAAYNAVSTSYEQYRKRVKDRYGEDIDYEMRYGVKREKINVYDLDENGDIIPKTKRKEEIEVITDMPSEYARYWGKYLKDGIRNENWDENQEFNLLFLRGVQAEANYKLHERGYVFLNEVYDMLGFDHTQLGQVVGWFDDESGDQYIDFGLYSLNNRENRRFINGEERTILLDFNCDGIIWDKI